MIENWRKVLFELEQFASTVTQNMAARVADVNKSCFAMKTIEYILVTK